MSTSPANQSEIKQLLQADSEYQTNLSRLNKMMKMGGSLSGHERNCAFPNLGGESFATVSSVAGIDFADDVAELQRPIGTAMVIWIFGRRIAPALACV